MKPSPAPGSLPYYVGRTRVAFAENGALGVARRATRVSVGRLSRALATAERHMFYRDAWARLPPSVRAEVARNERFRGRHAGRRAFVLATGPSLAREDLAPLEGEITIGLNAFFRHPDLGRWQPTYYVLMDRQFFGDTDPSFAEFRAELRARLTRSQCFVPAIDYPRVVSEKMLGDLPVAPLAFDGVLDDLDADPKLSTLSLTTLLPTGTTVAQAAALVALDMGCSPVYLLGCDHDWLHTGGFYQPSSFDGGTTVRNVRKAYAEPNYGEQAGVVYRMWKGYAVVARAAEARGARVINATDGGCLDVFERASLADVLRAG